MALALRSYHALPNLDLTVDTRYPNGDKPQVQPSSLGLDTAAFNAANINLLNRPQGTPQTYNYRQYLTGTSAATATLVVNAITGTLGNWQTDPTGNGPTNAGTLAGSGSLQVIASDNAGHSVSYPVQPWSILAPAQQQRKKWDPGHGMGSNSVLRLGSLASSVYFETDAMANLDLVRFYRVFATWGHIEQTLGVYNWTEIDNLLNRLNRPGFTPKKLVLCFLPGEFGSTHPNDTGYSTIPQYIMQGSTYGVASYATWNFSVNPATVVVTTTGSHGWSGGNGNGNTYAACLHRPAVNARWIALHQAAAARYNNDPRVLGIWMQENSWWIGASSANRCADYTNAAVHAGMRTMVDALVAAWPNTNIQYQNSWAGDITLTQQLTTYMLDRGVMIGNADTWGLSKITSTASGGLNGSLGTWGLDAYQGRTTTGSTFSGPDRRSSIPSTMDVEGPDIGANGYGTKFSTGRADVLAALRSKYGAANAAWTYMLSNSFSTGQVNLQSVWTGTDGLGNWLNDPANALTNTAYPSNVSGYT